MLCSAALYERICTIPFPPSFFLPSFSYACMHAWLGFGGGGGGAIIDVVVFVFVVMEREESKKNKGDGKAS